MKGLRKYIAPFAPDQSGAAAVFCELGGLVIILDAGGCAGNICGFDEPRWFESKSAIFSAGLRDMDAILGRDDRLVEKIGMACEKIEGTFIAVIGTPVPAVIGTDYKALKRMIEKKTGMPVMTVDTNGMELYDEGAKKAYLELFRTFRREAEKLPGSLGILGATPLDIVELEDTNAIISYYKERGWEKVNCFGMGSGISAVQEAPSMEKNLVLSPAGLPAAKYLEKQYGIPYVIDYPLETLPEWETFSKKMPGWNGKKVLIVHQQVLAHALREEIGRQAEAEITAASWFGLEKELKKKGDIHLKEEDQWISLVEEGGYDIIIGDELFLRAVPDYQGELWNLPHFAVSGKPSLQSVRGGKNE